MSTDPAIARGPAEFSARAGWIAGAVLMAFVAAMPLFVGDHIVTAAIVALHLVFLAQGWNIAAGYAGQFSLGHSVFVGLGAYASTLLYTRLGISPWLGMAASFLVAALAGAVIAAIAFRYRVRGVFFAVLTLASMDVTKGLFDNWDWVEGPVGIFITMASDPLNMLFFDRAPYLWLILAMVAGMALVTWRLEHSRFGQYLLALKEDEDAAEASGVDTYRCKVLAVALSAGLTGLGGTFYAQFMLWISPDTLFVFEHQLNMMLGAMVGGAGTVAGPVVGSVLFGIIAEVLRNLPDLLPGLLEGRERELISSARMAYAAILMAVMLYLPGGLISLLFRRRRLAAQAVAVGSG